MSVTCRIKLIYSEPFIDRYPSKVKLYTVERGARINTPRAHDLPLPASTSFADLQIEPTFYFGIAIKAAHPGDWKK